MTSELSKYLNELLGVFVNEKQKQKWSQQKTKKKRIFKKKMFCMI